MPVKKRSSNPSKDEQWKLALRASVHPVLALLLVNVGVVFYTYPINRWFLAAFFWVLLPGGALVALVQTLNTRIASSNLGVFPRSERPIAYWINVAVLFAVYGLLTATLIFHDEF